MKLTDRRLYQARSLEDLAFRYWFRDEDNQHRRDAIREKVGLVVTQQDKQNFVVSGLTPFVSPDTNRIWGVDVSGRWDGLVNFQVTADFGAKFAISKAVDGTIPTPYFKENNQSAYDAGLLNGAYAWLYPDSRANCTLQAQAFYNIVKDSKLRLPPTVDFEWTKYAGIQANPNYSDLRKWLAAFIRFSGVKPILYTAPGYVALFGTIPADILEMLSGVHVASYGGTQPTLLKGVNHWDIWQFSANGDALTLAPGNQGKRELDLNYMTEDFYQRYAVTQPQEEGTQMAYRGTVTATATLQIRSGPGTNYSDIGDLHYGDKVEASEIIGGWWKINQVVRSNGTVLNFVTDAYAFSNNGVYIRTDAVPPTEPPAQTFPAEIGLTLNGVTKQYILKA